MPRPPDPKAKHAQIIIKPRNVEEELKIRGAKEIVARNPDLHMINILDPFLQKHHWPPGNSQTVLAAFGGELTLICFRCNKKFRRLKKVEYISGVIGHSCNACIKEDREKRVIKRVLGTV